MFERKWKFQKGNSAADTYVLNEWLDHISWDINQGLLKKTKLKYSVIVLSENKEYWFIFIFFYNDWEVFSFTNVWNNLNQH